MQTGERNRIDRHSNIIEWLLVGPGVSEWLEVATPVGFGARTKILRARVTAADGTLVSDNVIPLTKPADMASAPLPTLPIPCPLPPSSWQRGVRVRARVVRTKPPADPAARVLPLKPAARRPRLRPCQTPNAEPNRA